MRILRIIYKVITFVIRTFFATVAYMWVYAPVSELALAERGYSAVGGEVIVAALAAAVVFVGLEWVFDYASPFPQDREKSWKLF